MATETPDSPLPYLVAVNLTKRCNLNCAHCYMDAQQRMSITEGEMEDEEVFGLFREIGSRAPGTIIVLTGGEPMLHPGLDGFVRAGSAEGLRMVLGTNGVLLTEKRAEALKQAGLEGMGISLDSIRAKAHDSFRGMTGAFEKTCEAVRICRRAGIHAQVHFTVTRWNRTEVAQAVEMARDLGAAIINFFFLVCVGRGQGSMDLAPSEYESSLKEIAALQKSSRGILVQTRCTPHFKRILHDADPQSPYTRATGYDGGGCLAGTHYCRITPKGEVTPCPYMELSAGNIRTEGFWGVWDQSRLFQSMRDPSLLEGRCGSCEFKLLCGGCRARALVEGNLMAEDPSCEYVPAGGEVLKVAEENAALTVAWTPEALDRLKKMPVFLRPMVKRKLEERARAEGVAVTPELMARHRLERERELGLKFK
ncbi:MAG: putative Radical superfamily protein Coenzyme synthesis protein [Fibrobacteres bacterium]|nr:putative Radical superfamily protein Coenzyme synthesis protein [Fibrobacterota bacterium]